MSEIEFVNSSTVKLVRKQATDLDVAMAAWVSNFGKHGDIELPADLVSPDWRKRDAVTTGSTGYLDEKDRQRVKGLINFLYRERHMSPFEHGSFTFFVDTPIFVAREFMRHRTGSYNETSGRYKELEPRFYLVDADRPVKQREGTKVGNYAFDPGTDEQYGQVFASTTLAYTSSWNAYQHMLEKGVAREVARNVLPVGIMTQFYVTMNPRNIMQFLLLRNDDAALYEIRQVAKEIENAFAVAMPFTYEAYKKNDWREEKSELALLRKKVAQMEAEETYRDNIIAGQATTIHARKRKGLLSIDQVREDEAIRL